MWYWLIALGVVLGVIFVLLFFIDKLLALFGEEERREAIEREGMQ